MYIRRPLCLLSGILALVLLAVTSFIVPKPSFDVDKADQRMMSITGKIMSKDIKDEKIRLFTDKRLIVELDINRYSFEDLKVGNCIKASGKFYAFEEPQNEGQFDSRKYYLIKGYEGTIKNGTILAKTDTFNRYKEALAICRKRAEKVFDSYLDEKDSGIMKAILLGDKNDLSSETKELYQNAGIIHILSLSGLHIAAVGLCLLKVLRKTKMPFALTAGISIFLMLSYAVMTGMSLSTQRALIMFILALLGEALSRTYDLLTAAALASDIVLIANPYYIQDSGFLLSFGAILAIGCVYPAFSSMTEKGYGFKAYKEPGPYLIEKIKKLLRGSLDGIIVSLSVSIVTLPVMANSYFKISRYSHLANIIVIPLMGVLLAAGFCGLSAGMLEYVTMVSKNRALAAALAKTSALILKIAHAILKIYELTAEKITGLYGNTMVTGKPSTAKVIIYYILVSLAVGMGYFRRTNLHNKQIFDLNSHIISKNSACNQRQNHNKITILTLSLIQNRINAEKTDKYNDFTDVKQQRKRKFGIMCNALILVMLTISIAILTKQEYKDLEIRNVSVGQGDCSVIFGKQTPVIIIDGGSSDVKNVGKYRILPVLLSNGISRIDYMFITHLDSDHTSGILEILNDPMCGITVKRVIISEAYINQSDEEEKAKLLELKTACDFSNTPIFTMSAGDTLDLEGISLECLWPIITDDIELSANEKSICLRLDDSSSGFSGIFTGDIGEESEKNMLEYYENGKITDVLNCDYLKVAHHGSRNSSSPEFLNAVSPKVSVISVGEDNSYGHPHTETLKRLMSIDGSYPENRIYRTDICGETIFTLDKGIVTMKTFIAQDPDS